MPSVCTALRARWTTRSWLATLHAIHIFPNERTHMETVRIFSIGDLAKKFFLAPQTIRNWEDWGKIPPSMRTAGGHRRYTMAHMRAVHELLYDAAVPLAVEGE